MSVTKEFGGKVVLITDGAFGVWREWQLVMEWMRT